ncbi:MAG: hypothetical protein JNL57_08095 [Bacteroidetes bacterium]|nr:hypothetical protein [Bacteroidota bacterium]
MRFTSCFLTIFAILPAWMQAQTLRIPLTERVEDAQYSKLIMVTQTFFLQGDSVSNPLDVSSAVKGEPVYWRNIVPPAYNKNMRMAYAWVYDGSVQDKFSGSHSLLVIENPGWTAYPTRIWVDRNHNFNLTDDGNPDTMTMSKPAIIHLAGDNYNGFKLWLEHFPVDQFPMFANMNDRSVEAVQGNRFFLGSASCFRERRLNVLAGRWKSSSDSFLIAVKDENCNGNYGDHETDVVMITDYNKTPDNLQGITLNAKGKAYLEWNNAAYTVLGIDMEVAELILLRDTAAWLKNTLNTGEKIPRFKYCTATKPQKRKSVRKLKGKTVYIYVWRDGAEEFAQDSAALHALGRLRKKDFTVLCLNYGASGRYVYRYNKRYDIELLQGFSSNDINGLLKVKKIPSGILINRKQKVLFNGISPLQVSEYLDGVKK